MCIFILPVLSQVLDVSGAAVLQAAVPSARVELLDSCGHSVSLERPRKAAKLIMDFVSEQGDDAKKHSWRKRYNCASQDGEIEGIDEENKAIMMMNVSNLL